MKLAMIPSGGCVLNVLNNLKSELLNNYCDFCYLNTILCFHLETLLWRNRTLVNHHLGLSLDCLNYDYLWTLLD